MSQTQINPPLASPDAGPRTNRQRLFKLWDTSGMLVVFLVLALGASGFIENFASLQNMDSLLKALTDIAFVACTMMLCLASGDFDLSVGSVVALSGMICALVIFSQQDHNHIDHAFCTVASQHLAHWFAWLITINPTNLASILSIVLGILAGLTAGALVGLFNGLLIAKAEINALIATLGTMQIVRGAAFLVNDGKSVGISNDQFGILGKGAWPSFNSWYPTWSFDPNYGFPYIYFWMAKGHFRGIAVPVWLMLGFFLVFAILLNRTTFGRNTLAIGGNKEAARLAGIAVDRTKIVIFTLQGLAAAFAGIILTSKLTSGQPNNGQGLELQAISACVLGGVALTGGVATMGGVMVGLLIMGTVQNALSLKGVSQFWQYVVYGSILLAAVLLDKVKQRLKR
jgi:L-arabinose transport system permease protein